MANGSMVSVDLPVYTINCFTGEAFAGNPAAVCLVDNPERISQTLMQKLENELRLPVTTFMSLINPKDSFKTASRFRARYFLPLMESPLCGHGTFAAAAVLFRCLNNPSESITFETQSGEVYVSQRKDRVVMNLTQPVFKEMDFAEIQELVKVTVGDLPTEEILLGVEPLKAKLLIRLADSVTRKQLEEMTPAINMMVPAHNTGSISAVTVTVRGSRENDSVDDGGSTYDFMSRVFIPWRGVDEDHVCGTAHTALGPYWAKVLNKKELYARQCSQRGGDIYVTVYDNGRVDVAGKSTLVIKGTISASL